MISHHAIGVRSLLYHLERGLATLLILIEWQPRPDDGISKGLTPTSFFVFRLQGVQHVSSKVDFHQSGIEKGTRERVRSKVTKFGYHYKFLSSF